MKKPSLTIGIGHDNAPNGQTGTAGELDLLKKVYFALAPLLQKAGIVVYYDDANVKNGAFTDYCIFPHFDGSTNSNYDGGFVDASPTSYTKDKDWQMAQFIADHYFSAMGIRFVPEHRTNNSTLYYGFNYTGQNTITFLIELGTLTNPSDKAKCQDYGKIANLLHQGIIGYLSQYDENYKAYIAGQATISNQTQIDELRQQLQEQTELVKDLQTKNKQLAEDLSKCQQTGQALSERLNKIKIFVSAI